MREDSRKCPLQFVIAQIDPGKGLANSQFSRSPGWLSCQRVIFLLLAVLYGLACRILWKIRWDENAGLRRDAISSQIIDALEAQGDKGDRQ